MSLGRHALNLSDNDVLDSNDFKVYLWQTRKAKGTTVVDSGYISR